MTAVRADVYMVTWIEPATGNTVTHVEDFANNVAYTNITDLATSSFWKLKGEIKPCAERPNAGLLSRRRAPAPLEM